MCIFHQSNKNKSLLCNDNNREDNRKKKEGWVAERSAPPKKMQNIFTTLLSSGRLDKSSRQISIHTLPWYNIPFMQSYISELLLLLVHVPKLQTVNLLLFCTDEPHLLSLVPPTSRVKKWNRNTSRPCDRAQKMFKLQNCKMACVSHTSS